MLVRIKESVLPSPKARAWTLVLTSGQETLNGECQVSVFGGRNSIKASFFVNLQELKEAVASLGE